MTAPKCIAQPEEAIVVNAMAVTLYPSTLSLPDLRSRYGDYLLLPG